MSWPLVSIKSVSTVTTGKTPSKKVESYFGGDIPFISPSELGEQPYALAPKQTLTQSGAARIKLVPKNSVLVCCIGSLGKLAIADRELATNQQINSVTFDENKVFPKFGYYALGRLKPVLESMAPATTVAIVSKSKFEELKIPLPPLDEQKRIASILDKADAIRRKRQQAIQLADDFLKSVFLDMFGDPVTNPKGWEVGSIDSVTSDWRGGAPFKPGDFSDSGVNVLHKGAVHKHNKISVDTKKKTYTTKEFAKKYKKSEVDRNYLAVTLRDLVPTGPSIGLVADLKHGPSERYILAQGAYGFRHDPERVAPSYLVYLSNNLSFRATLSKYWVGSTQIHIRTPVYKEIEIPLPPIALQRKFEAFVNSVASLKGKFVDEPSQSGALFNALSQKAFAGEL